YFKSGQRTIFHRFFESFFYRWDKFFRNVTTFDFVYELQTGFAFICRTDFKYDICKFTTTTRLFLVHLSVISSLSKRFFVFYLRLALVYFYFELSSHTVYNDVQVKFTHTGDDGLSGRF